MLVGSRRSPYFPWDPFDIRAPQPRGSQHLVGQLNAQLGIERGLVNPDGSVLS